MSKYIFSDRAALVLGIIKEEAQTQGLYGRLLGRLADLTDEGRDAWLVSVANGCKDRATIMGALEASSLYRGALPWNN